MAAAAAAVQVLMYDEPTAGLDPIASTVVEDLIRSLGGDVLGGGGGGDVSSYIVVTHQHSTIRRAVDRLIFLHQGKVPYRYRQRGRCLSPAHRRLAHHRTERQGVLVVVPPMPSGR